jgi:VanZ family protein
VTPLRRLSLALAAVALVALAFLALRPSPFVDQVAWIPHRLGHWADHNGVLRNTVAFFAVGLLYFSALGRRWPHALGLAVFATALEVAQCWIPHRVFDVSDIAASLAGLALAWLLVVLARFGWTKRRA